MTWKPSHQSTAPNTYRVLLQHSNGDGASTPTSQTHPGLEARLRGAIMAALFIRRSNTLTANLKVIRSVTRSHSKHVVSEVCIRHDQSNFEEDEQPALLDGKIIAQHHYSADRWRAIRAFPRLVHLMAQHQYQVRRWWHCDIPLLHTENAQDSIK